MLWAFCPHHHHLQCRQSAVFREITSTWRIPRLSTVVGTTVQHQVSNSKPRRPIIEKPHFTTFDVNLARRVQLLQLKRRHLCQMHLKLFSARTTLHELQKAHICSASACRSVDGKERKKKKGKAFHSTEPLIS